MVTKVIRAGHRSRLHTAVVATALAFAILVLGAQMRSLQSVTDQPSAPQTVSRPDELRFKDDWRPRDIRIGRMGPIHNHRPPFREIAAAKSP